MNGYDDIADMIDEIISEFAESGNRTRRNWWDILAGGKEGKPRSQSGRIFPVLKAAQVRQGLPVTPNAIERNPNEVAPPIIETGRWNVKNGQVDKKGNG
jgi:hypothetical protein